MPNENLDGLEQPPPGEIDRMESDWKAEQHQAENARIQELLESTDRLIEMIDKNRQERKAAAESEPTAVLEIPPEVQSSLDAQRDDYDRRWEIEDAKSTPRTAAQLREELEDEGLRREPPTPEEVEAASLQEDADKRAEAAAKNPDKKHARNLHRKSPVRYVSPRDKGAPKHIARQIRGDDL